MDERFKKCKDAVKIYIPMCQNCGLCCLDKDWSTDFLGDLYGICRNLDIEKGCCIDEQKKSIECRTYICRDFEDFRARFHYVRKRECSTSNRLLQELVIRKRKDLSDNEMEQLYERELKWKPRE